MNGELLLKGYKFSERMILNLQDKTVLTGEDAFIAFELFNMLENYFNRKTFSNYYLDKGTILILNGNILSSEEFVVFRINPIVNLAEELKLTKKSILGQVVQALFPTTDDRMSLIADALQKSVLTPLNEITKDYKVSYTYDDDDILTIAKILFPVVKEQGGQEILTKEHDQFHCKVMLLNFISRLKLDKKKLLLMELPEYGLRDYEVVELLNLLPTATIDNIIVYTMKQDICKIIPQIFNYNVIKNGKLCGFDDYDQLEITLKNLFIGSSEEEIQQKVLEYIFQPQSKRHRKDEFSLAVEKFLN